MPVHFDHTIIPARDRRASAAFLADVLGLDEPTEWGPFSSVALDGDVVLQFAEPPVDFPGHHYAFLVDDATFDHLLGRIEALGLPHWADPRMTTAGINTDHGGRGVYFDDPSGHHLEAITARYGADQM